MAYKRYIKRGDKVYGPYVYHSRKVNGKVISEYHGTSKKVDRKKKQKALINSLKFVGIILFSLFLIYLAFIITNEELRIENFLGERFSITGHVIGADECGTLSSPGYYTLNESLTSTGTCFTINSDNVTLDCDNFWINYSSSGGSSTYGVYLNYVENVTIKNCNIVDETWVATSNDKYGIYLLYSNNSVLDNNFVNTYNESAIYFKLSNNNTLVDNNGTCVGSGGSIRCGGIYLYVSLDNNLTNNFGMSVRGPGIMLTTGSHNNTLVNNTGRGYGTAWDSSGILLVQSSNNNLTNNTGISEEKSGIHIYSGSNYSRLVNNSGTSTINDSGIKLSTNSNYNVLIDNLGRAYGTSYTSAGIMVFSTSSNNNLTNNTGISQNREGLYIYASASNNIVINNTFRSNGTEVVKISTNSLNNTLKNNTFISEDGDGNLLLVGTDSTGNLVYYNNFTETTGLYVVNSLSNNDTQFNTTVGGEPRGNYYFNITSINITDSDGDGWGDSGSDYPLNETNWPAKWSLSGTDYGPYISEPDSTAPTITWENPTPADGDAISDNFTYLNTTITDASDTSAWFDWNKSLIGYWSMDYYNSTGVYDNSSYDNFGLFQGDLGTDNLTTGKRGNALDFDGVDDSVDIGNLSIAGDQMTITAWIRSDNLSNCNYSQCRVISKANGSTDAEHYWMISTNDAQTLRFRLKTEGVTSVLYGRDNILQNNVWAHIAAVYNSTHMLLYADGVLVGNMSKTGNLDVNDTVSVWIGDSPPTPGSKPWDGLIDEVMIFNRSLSPEEINASYNAGTYRLMNNFTNLSEGTYNYSVYAIDAAGNINITSPDRQVTIDATTPQINITNPLPINYSINVSELNYTYTETNPDKCWWSNSSGEWNSSTQTCGTNWTNLISSEGWNNWTVYINDTSGNENSSNVTFFKDTTPPEVEIVSPTSGQTFTSSTVSFSVKTNEASTCNYTLNAGATNTTMTANATSTGFTDSQSLSNAAYTALFYCEDLFNNLNNTESVSFTVNVQTPGGRGGGTTPSIEFSIPALYEETISLGGEKIGETNITNEGTRSQTFIIEIESLDNIIFLEREEIVVDARSKGQLRFTILSPNETGIYTGKIIVTLGSVSKEMLVIISVTSIPENESLLFDASLRIPFFMRVRKPDSNLLTNINLLQLGAEEEVNVVLEYVIKDFEDTVHFTESGGTSIYKEKAFDKYFDLKGLPEGEYVVGLEVIYQDSVAIASSQFNIKSRTLSLLEIIGAILFLAIIILLIILLFIIRKRKSFIIRPYK